MEEQQSRPAVSDDAPSELGGVRLGGAEGRACTGGRPRPGLPRAWSARRSQSGRRHGRPETACSLPFQLADLSQLCQPHKLLVAPRSLTLTPTRISRSLSALSLSLRRNSLLPANRDCSRSRTPFPSLVDDRVTQRD